MKNTALLLIIAGLVVLLDKGFSYTKTTQLIDAGPLQASVHHTEHMPVEPLAGACAVAGGLLILLRARKPA